MGKTAITNKRQNPFWIPPDSIRKENPKLPEIVPPGPDNPLGNYALYLDDAHHSKWHNIIIHGTNAPRSIGSEVSHGCIRLYPQDIKKLFAQVEVGVSVNIVNQPIKIAERNDKIYLEVHLKESDPLSEGMSVGKLICRKIKDCGSRVSWQKVDEALMQNLGIPIEIGH